eukprot:4251020-Prymnesium_polylepis.1
MSVVSRQEASSPENYFYNYCNTECEQTELPNGTISITFEESDMNQNLPQPYPTSWFDGEFNSNCLTGCRYIIRIPEAREGDYIGCFSFGKLKGEPRLYNEADDFVSVTCEGRQTDAYSLNYLDVGNDLHLRYWNKTSNNSYILHFESGDAVDNGHSTIQFDNTYGYPGFWKLPWKNNAKKPRDHNFGTVNAPVNMILQLPTPPPTPPPPTPPPTPPPPTPSPPPP